MITRFDFFTGGVPAGEILQIELEQIRKLITEFEPGLIGQELEQIAFIGATAYFEGFCKDSYASLINISPSLIKKVKATGVETRVDSEAILELKDRISYSIGSLISENLDFGSAKKINGLYKGILNITPFSTSDKGEYDRLLADRNLLVHHGGIYTRSYIKQRLKPSDLGRVFLDSLVVDREYVLKRIAFFEKIAKKTINSTKSSMDKLILSGEIKLDKLEGEALSMYPWWSR